jgi:uncharacterized RDD family membrane protein YckC
MSAPRKFDARETERLKELEAKTLAPFLRRAAAYALDIVIASVIAASLDVLFLFFAGKNAAGQNIDIKFDFENWYSIAALIFYFGLATYLGNGQTLGKKFFGIRVVSLTHPKITFWQAVERALGYGASILEAGLGFLQFFWHHNRQTVHDRIAETIVVDERASSAG